MKKTYYAPITKVISIGCGLHLMSVSGGSSTVTTNRSLNQIDDDLPTDVGSTSIFSGDPYAKGQGTIGTNRAREYWDD